jgi:heterodisulfide reductase subunit C
MKRLHEIREEKIWQRGLDKLYYTQLTDVLREYLSQRFTIQAMEMTSNEILTALRSKGDALPVIEKLKQIFSVSDMVKFAKRQPTIEENESSLVNAFFSVQETIVQPLVPLIEEIEKEKEETLENVRTEIEKEENL